MKRDNNELFQGFENATHLELISKSMAKLELISKSMAKNVQAWIEDQTTDIGHTSIGCSIPLLITQLGTRLLYSKKLSIMLLSSVPNITYDFKKMSIIPKIMPTEFYNLQIFLLS